MIELKEPDIQTSDVRAVRTALEVIRKGHKDGLLLASEVVAAARDEKSPLHRYVFCEDDQEAAYQRRLELARSLIRKIEVILPDDPTETPVPRYISLVTDRSREGGGYRQTADVMRETNLLAELEDTAKRELDSWSKRYQMLTGLVSRVRAAALLDVPAKPRRKKARKKARK